MTSIAVRQFQSESDAIREAPEPVSARIAVLALAAMVLACIGVTAFASVDRVVTSLSGKVVSTQAANVFQALDPSIIKSIDVREGDRVQAGQLLATLDPTFAAADVGQLKMQIAGLDAQIARAEAEQKGKPLVFPDNPGPDLAPYAALQKSLYAQRTAEFAAQIKSYDEKIKQAQATIDKYQGDEARYKEREKISQQIEEMRHSLLKSGAGSLLNLWIASDQRLELLRTMEFGHNSLIEAQHVLSSLMADRDAYVQKWFTDVSQELVTARNARDLAATQLVKATKHQDLVRLTAPEPAVVLSLSKLSVGSVLKEGDPLLTLMPLRAPMEAEVHLSPRDIGFVRAGDHCALKIDAFNFFEHGTAEGQLEWISEGAFTTDDDGKPVDAFYKARVRVDAIHFIGVPDTFRLIPGMTLTADIHVGTRSVLAYLFGGFFRGMGESMREP